MILKTLVCFGLFNFGCLAASEIVNNDNISTDENELSCIERPCRVFDMFCIRQYFAQHSGCKKTFGPTPSPLYKAQSTFYVPSINVTITSLNVYYTLNGIVEEFYINKKTDNLLLAVEFKDLIFSSNENYLRFHRKGKEPIVNVDFLNTTFSSVVVTIIIPNLKDLKLQDGEVFLYINDKLPPFVLGPRVFLSTDPQVEETFVKLFANIPTVTVEALFIDAAFFIGSFIQYNICDFGIEIL